MRDVKIPTMKLCDVPPYNNTPTQYYTNLQFYKNKISVGLFPKTCKRRKNLEDQICFRTTNKQAFPWI